MSFNPEPHSQDDLQSEQISALLTGQEHLVKQMAEIVIAHKAIVRRHEEDVVRIERIEKTVDGSATLLLEMKEVVSTVAALKGGLKVLGWLGAAVKWITLVGGPIYIAFYALTHGGKMPHQ